MADNDPLGLLSALVRPEAKIANIIDEFRVVINQGSTIGVRVGDTYMIYKIGKEIFDPDTKQSLGKLEIVKGNGEVIHVQENMATLQTTEKHEVRRTNPFVGILGGAELSKELRAFINPELGDRAKLIRKSQ